MFSSSCTILVDVDFNDDSTHIQDILTMFVECLVKVCQILVILSTIKTFVDYFLIILKIFLLVRSKILK